MDVWTSSVQNSSSKEIKEIVGKCKYIMIIIG